MLSGWYQVNSKWYFSDKNGVMQTGWITDNGKSYYLEASGAWIPSISREFEGKIFVIDPGHGGNDSGAVSGKVYEKTINLQVGAKLSELLKKHGGTVHMTRSTDVFLSLDERVNFSNSINPDAFISIHANSATATSAQGLETFYNSTNGVMPIESNKLATYIQEELVNSTSAKNRGVKVANHRVTRGNNAPAILVELGFISNDADRANLINDNYQNKLATGIFNGLMKYFYN